LRLNCQGGWGCCLILRGQCHGPGQPLDQFLVSPPPIRGDTGYLPSETRREPIPGDSEKTSLFFTVPEGRYPISPLGVVGSLRGLILCFELVAAELIAEGHFLDFAGGGVGDFVYELDAVGHPPFGDFAVEVGQDIFGADV